jgi:hypothetical protein
VLQELMGIVKKHMTFSEHVFVYGRVTLLYLEPIKWYPTTTELYPRPVLSRNFTSFSLFKLTTQNVVFLSSVMQITRYRDHKKGNFIMQ